MSPNQKDLVVLKELIEAGKVTPVLDQGYPLTEVGHRDESRRRRARSRQNDDHRPGRDLTSLRDPERGGVVRLLRELSRRKLRTTLTILGITIGIWTLVVFSSMANKINGFVGSGSEFYADKIIVTDGESFGTSPMRLDAVRRHRRHSTASPPSTRRSRSSGTPTARASNFGIPKTGRSA